ncbi:MAG: hypothetical protein GT601_17330, partial [Acidaminobacter sp.]|nr:hypothetical protein [Acidaminobacter sp.]
MNWNTDRWEEDLNHPYVNEAIIAGQETIGDGKLVFKGKLGAEISDQEGYAAVRLCTLNTLTLINYYANGLD